MRWRGWNWKGSWYPPGGIEMRESEEGEGVGGPAGGRAGPRWRAVQNARIGRVHRYPLAKLKCVSPKRLKQIAARLGGEPGRASAPRAEDPIPELPDSPPGDATRLIGSGDMNLPRLEPKYLVSRVLQARFRVAFFAGELVCQGRRLERAVVHTGQCVVGVAAFPSARSRSSW